MYCFLHLNRSTVDSETMTIEPDQKIHIDIRDSDQIVVPFWNWSSISIDTEQNGQNTTQENNCYRSKSLPYVDQHSI